MTRINLIFLFPPNIIIVTLMLGDCSIMYIAKIFVFDENACIADSTKCLLESHDFDVMMLSDDMASSTFPKMDRSDTVVIHLLAEAPRGFKLLNDLMFSPSGPNIVLTTSYNAEVLPSDYFPGNRVTVLQNPVQPKDLIQAIQLH